MSVRVARSPSANSTTTAPSSPRGGGAAAMTSSLFPNTNNTSGYRPPTSPRSLGGGGASSSAMLSSYSNDGNGGGPSSSVVGGYRPTSSTAAAASGAAPNSPRGGAAPLGTMGGLSAASVGPRVGAALVMTRVDLVADRNAAQTIAGLKEAAANAAAGGMGASYSNNGGSNTTRANSARANAPVDLQNGIHIIIPAPPPSWSGGGVPSSVIQRSFLAAAGGTGSAGGNQSHGGAMVTVTESPFYTHQSLKEAQKGHEARLAEASMKQVRRNAGASSPSADDSYNASAANVGADGLYKPKGIIQSSIPPAAGSARGLHSGPKSIVVVPLSIADMADGGRLVMNPNANNNTNNNSGSSPARGGNGGGGDSPPNNNGSLPSPSMAAPPVGTTTICPLSSGKLKGAPTVSSEGDAAARQHSRNVGGVAVVEVTEGPSPAAGGPPINPLVEQRAGIKLNTQAEELYRSEMLVAEAVRQAEANAHIYTNPSFNLTTPDRRNKASSSNGTNNNNSPGKNKQQGEVLAMSTFTPVSAISVGEDQGRDRVLASSVRYGHHSEALQKAAAQSQQRVGFAIEMAPTLGAAPPSSAPSAARQQQQQGLIPSPPPLSASRSVGGAGKSHHATVQGYGEARTAPSSPVAFGLASPRFGADSINPTSPSAQKKKERAPPVGHYNIKYGKIETNPIRDIFFFGHGTPYDGGKGAGKNSRGNSPSNSLNNTTNHSPSAGATTDSAPLSPFKNVAHPPSKKNAYEESTSLRHMSASERREAEARRLEANANARAHLGVRERARAKLIEEEELRAAEGPKQTSAFMSSLPRLQTSPRRDAEIISASAIGNTPYGEFNEGVLSTSPRTKCGVRLGPSSGVGRDQPSNWDRRPDAATRPAIRETHYTGALFGDKRDATAFPRGYTDMDRQVGRGLPMHSHQASQQATGGSQLLPGQSAPLNSLDLQDLPAGNINATNKFKNTTGTGTSSVNAMGKQSPRKFTVKPAYNVSSDERPDVLGVAFGGSDATKGPKSPIAFGKQTSRPDVVYKSDCAVETYDTEYQHPNGTIVSSLQAKNDATSPRTRQTDFNRMGSHNDYNSFAKAAERMKQHDADVGMGDAAVQSGFVHTRPRTLKNVDFTHLAPRKDDTKILTESCADPNNIYPYHILHDRVGGDPRLNTHMTRETARKATAIKPARTTDTFYDVGPNVGYAGDRCKPPLNPVDISNNTGRDAYGHHRNVTAAHLSAAHTGNTNSGGAAGGNKYHTNNDPRKIDATANLGPGQYDYNVKVLSKPLPAVAFGKQVELPPTV